MIAERLENLKGSTPDTSEVDPLSNLVIVGGGTMGQGITISAAKKGIEVLLIEKDEKSLKRSLAEMNDDLDREIVRWALTEGEKKSILSRIKGEVGYQSISPNHVFILETISENIDQKKELLTQLDSVCSPEAILITNTSTISITELASATSRPDRFIGVHFLNPVPKVRLVELVRGLNTSLDTFNKALQLVGKLEATPIEVFESPGYVTTRVMMPLVNEAIQVLMEGIASAEDIDKAIRIGYDLPWGPLEMADRIGLDSILYWLEKMFTDLGDTKYKPCPMLRMLVRAGNLGLKTKRGFYSWDNEERVIPGSGQRAAAYERFLDITND